MSIDFIELLDSQIITTEDVIIEEERIKDEYAVFFNDAQIQSHLTHLLYNDAFNTKIIGKKVENFFSLLSPHTVDHSTAPEGLKPIISCKKHVHFVDDDDYIPDNQFEEEQHIVMSAFVDFIHQFDALNRDTRNKYTITKEKLDNLSRPFVTTGGPENHHVVCDTDGLDTLNRPLRVVPNDKVRLVGYYTGERASAHTRHEVNLQAYIDNVKLLKTTQTNQPVTIVFNDFAFRKEKLVLQTAGHVHNGIAVFDKPVTVDGALINSMLIDDQRIFIFPKTSDIKPFSKHGLKTGNYTIMFDDSKTTHEYLLPVNTTQALFIEYMAGKAQLFSDIANIHGDRIYRLEEKHRHLIEWILKSTNAPAPKKISGTLHNNGRIFPPQPRDKITYVLEKFKKYLAHVQQTLDKATMAQRIDQLNDKLKTFLPAHSKECGEKPRSVKIVKTYALITEIQAEINSYADGEHVALHQPLFANDIVFVLKTVKGKKTWVKVRNLNNCASDTLLTPITDICLYDSAEKACQSLTHVRMMREKHMLEQKLQILKDLLSLANDPLDNINMLITFFDMVANHHIMRNFPFDANFHGHYEKVIADADLFGEEIPFTFEELMNHAEANDVHLPLGPRQQDKPSDDHDMVTILSKYLDINFTNDQLAFMKQYVGSRYSVSDLDKQLMEERARLMAAINRDMYQSNKGYRAKVDAKIEERLKTFMEAKYEKFYYEEIIFSAALIQCMLLALHPSVELAKIVPKCSALYSVVGHPINTSKPLENYLACALKQIAIQDDTRYKLILSSNKIEADIRTAIDGLLEQDYTLAQQIEKHKDMLTRQKTPKHNVKTTEAPLNVSFKPAFNFPQHPSNTNITFLKTLNDVVAKLRYNKVNIKKSAFISNFCCPEKLTEDTYYYNIFGDDIQKSIDNVQQKTATIDNSHTSFPPLHVQEKPSAPPMPTVSHKQWGAISTPEDAHIKPHTITDEEFNDTLYPRLNQNFEQLLGTLPKAIDNVNMDAMYFIRDTLINNMNSNPKLHRMVLYNFLSNKLPLLVSRWMNGLVIANDELSKTVRSNMPVRTLLQESWSYVKVFGNTIIGVGTEDACVKDVIAMLDSLFVYLLHLSVTSGEHVKLVHTLINAILSALAEHFHNNIFDNQQVLKNIEELREQKKQTMMDAYAVDDEERTIQIQLRNIGVADWTSVFDRIKNIDLANINGQREENENYNMANDVGENDDANEMNDDTF